MEIEHKCVGVSGLKVLDAEQGLVETIVSVTGLRDNVKDIIEPGAYEKSLATRVPKGVWHHNWHESISRTEKIKELLPGDADLPKTMPNGEPWPAEAGALKVVTKFNLETQRGREAYSDVKFFGSQQEWSIGYNVPAGGAHIDSKTGIRHIKALELFEYSPVLFGAMPSAHTTSVKDAQMAYKALNSADVETFMTETKTMIDDIEAKVNDIPLSEVEMAPNVAEELVPVDDVDPAVEEVDEDDSEWDEEDVDDEPDEKSMFISAAQSDLLTKAINVMQDLLGAGAGEFYESKSAETEDMVVADMSELFGGIETDEELDSAIKAFDDAYDNDDLFDLSESAETILDYVEKSLEDGDVDPGVLAAIGSYIHNSIQEKAGVAGTEVKDGSEAADDYEATGYAALSDMDDEEKSAFIDEHTELVEGEYGEKMRRVRTSMGEQRFKLNIGDIIGHVPNTPKTVMDAVIASQSQSNRSHAIMATAWARKKNMKSDELDIENKTTWSEALHPRATGGTFTYATDSGSGDARKGAKDKNAADGKVTGRVSAAQTALIKAGVLGAKDGRNGHGVDGLLGPKTEAALKKYQAKEGLAVTGRLDKGTMNKMGIAHMGASAGKKPSMTKKPKASASVRHYKSDEEEMETKSIDIDALLAEIDY